MILSPTDLRILRAAVNGPVAPDTLRVHHEVVARLSDLALVSLCPLTGDLELTPAGRAVLQQGNHA